MEPATLKRKKRKLVHPHDAVPPPVAAGSARSMIIIPNLDANITPLLIEAIKSFKKFIQMKFKFQKLDDMNIEEYEHHSHYYEEQFLSNHTATESDLHVTEDIFQRMKRREESLILAPFYKQMQDTNESVSRLCQALELYNPRQSSSSIRMHMSDMKMNPSSSSTETNTLVASTNDTACFDFIMDMILQKEDGYPHGVKQVSLKHSCILMLKELMKRRKGLYYPLFLQQIKPFVDFVGDANQGIDTGTMESEYIVQMQKEALRFMTQMANEDGFQQGRIPHPTVHIACRYLIEQKGISILDPHSNVGGPKNNGEMICLRNQRDQAIKHAGKECRTIDKVLKLIHECIDIIVPRFGHERIFITSIQKSQEEFNVGNGYNGEKTSILMTDMINNNNYDDDHNDDDIEWEDGDYLDDVNKEESYNHLLAVEQTLAVMKQSGTLQHGTIEVDFSKNSNHSQNNSVDIYATTEDTNNIEIAKDRLNKCVQVLKKRLEVLTEWHHALLHSDNMIESKRLKSSECRTDISGGSLIVLPRQLREGKGAALRLITFTKFDVQRTLAAVERLVDKESPSPIQEDEKVVKDQQAVNARNGGVNAWMSDIVVPQKTNNVKDRLESSCKNNPMSTRNYKSKVHIKLRRS